MNSRLPLPRALQSGLVLLAAIVFPSGGAFASDGVLEINATCAAQTGCFPSDAPGYPVTITQPGSYRLTSDLAQTVIPTLTTASTAIEISAFNVSLDLNGFSIRCTSPLGGCSGAAAGIATAGAVQSIAIRNGSISEMPGRGIDASSAQVVSIEGVRATGNGDIGIYGGRESIVRDSIAARNGDDGIVVDVSSIVMSNVVSGNAGDQISGSRGTLVRDNVVQYTFASPLSLLSTSGYRDNVFWGGPGGFPSTDAENLGGNLCDGTLCP